MTVGFPGLVPSSVRSYLTITTFPSGKDNELPFIHLYRDKRTCPFILILQTKEVIRYSRNDSDIAKDWLGKLGKSGESMQHKYKVVYKIGRTSK